MLVTNEQIEAHWNAIRIIMEQIDRKIFQQLGHRVQTGPFKGMIVTDRPNWNDGNASLKLLGCYEHELWESVELAISRKPSAVINVGCAEGYYAIGLKLRMPDTPVIAIDINAKSLEQCADMARRNGVAIKTRIGAKTPRELQLGYRNALYVVDCEADELDVLDPLRCPDLLSADVIVECHDHVKPISYQLARRFEATHEIDVIDAQVSSVQTYKRLLDPLPIGTQVLAVTEKRPLPTVFLAMMSKQRA